MSLSKQYTNVCSCSKPSFISLFENRNENQIGPVSLFILMYAHNSMDRPIDPQGPVAYKESRKGEANYMVAKQIKNVSKRGPVYIIRLEECGIQETYLHASGAFYLCWCPYIVISDVVASQGPSVSKELNNNKTLINFGVNPCIYAWRNAEFKKAYKKLLRFS